MSKVNTPTTEYKVYFEYETQEYEDGNIVYTGTTNCRIFNVEDKLLALGHSSCNVGDQFIKREGRKIAMTRALKQLHLTREDRLVFWKTLFPQYFRS